MEKNKKSKNIALGVAISIIVILVIALVISLYFFRNLKTEVENKNDEISKLNENINVLSEQIVEYNNVSESDLEVSENQEKTKNPDEINTELDELSIAIKVFSEYLDGYKVGGKEQVDDESRIKNYTFTQVKAVTDEELNELGIDSENRIVVSFTYDIELYNSAYNSLWTAGNGLAEGNWVRSKSNFVWINIEGNEYKFEATSTGL